MRGKYVEHKFNCYRFQFIISQHFQRCSCHTIPFDWIIICDLPLNSLGCVWVCAHFSSQIIAIPLTSDVRPRAPGNIQMECAHVWKLCYKCWAVYSLFKSDLTEHSGWKFRQLATVDVDFIFLFLSKILNVCPIWIALSPFYRRVWHFLGKTRNFLVMHPIFFVVEKSSQ